MAPSSHSASITSGENLPVLRTSATMFQISSAGAAIGIVTDACIANASLSIDGVTLTVQVTDWSGEDYAKISSLQRAMIREARAGLALTDSDRVLDVGCGDGWRPTRWPPWCQEGSRSASTRRSG